MGQARAFGVAGEDEVRVLLIVLDDALVGVVRREFKWCTVLPATDELGFKLGLAS